MNDDHADLGGPGAGTDQLEERFRALHVDTDSVILAESSAVRRRGERRRRTTQAGAVLGIAVLAVAVVGVGTTLTDRPAAAPPAATSPSPSVSPSSRSLAANPLLRPADISPIGVYDNFTTSADPSVEGLRLACLNDPGGWGPLGRGANTWATQTFASDLDATFTETVLQFEDSAAAAAAIQQTVAAFDACPTGDATEAAVVDRNQGLAVGDEAHQLSRTTTPTADADPGYNEVALARSGTIVVVLDWTSMGSPVAGAGWAWTPEQLDIALERATAPPLDPSQD